LVYFGKKIVIGDIIIKPKHGITQQVHDRFIPRLEKNVKQHPLNPDLDLDEGDIIDYLRNAKFNLDGFGIGWYVDNFDEPCLYTSIYPACNDHNLISLANKLKSDCVFAHIRAASPGSRITTTNCHPFQFGKILFMHNGSVARFPLIKQDFIKLLPREWFVQVQGTTDSELAGALFCNLLPKNTNNNYTIEEFKQTMINLIKLLISTIREFETKLNLPHQPSSLNFAVTDGTLSIVTRYRDHPDENPPSLYFTLLEHFEIKNGDEFHMKKATEWSNNSTGLVVCSEPLTFDMNEWEKVPKNSIICVTKETHVVENIPLF